MLYLYGNYMNTIIPTHSMINHGFGGKSCLSSTGHEAHVLSVRFHVDYLLPFESLRLMKSVSCS